MREVSMVERKLCKTTGSEMLSSATAGATRGRD